MTENGIKYPTLVRSPSASTTLPTSQQQPQDLQQSEAVSDQKQKIASSPRELLDAALMKPVHYESGFSVLRTVSVPRDQKYQDFFDQNDGVQKQVIETLKKILGLAVACNSRVEYVMGRMNDQAELKPTILICCADKDQRRKVINHFMTQRFTMAGFSYSIEVDPVVLASGSVDLEPLLRGNMVRADDPVNHESLCGLACEVIAETDRDDSTSLNSLYPLARLTVGGLICVDTNNLYALTTAHSFIETSNSSNTPKKSLSKKPGFPFVQNSCALYFSF